MKTAAALARLRRLTALSGGELRDIRRNCGLSQSVFGELVGLTSRRLADYELGADRHGGKPLAVPPGLALAARLIDREMPRAAPPRPGRKAGAADD